MPAVLRTGGRIEVDLVRILAGRRVRRFCRERIALIQVPANRFSSCDWPRVRAFPFSFSDREVKEKSPGIESGVHAFQIMIEEPQPFVALHDMSSLIFRMRTGVLSTTMIPRSDHRALIVAERHEAADDGISRAGIEPASPT